MHKLLFFVLTTVSLGYALDYVDNRMQMKPYYSPMYQYNPRINQPTLNQSTMMNDYGLPMGVPQASEPYTRMNTDVEIGNLELARFKPIQRPTS